MRTKKTRTVNTIEMPLYLITVERSGGVTVVSYSKKPRRADPCQLKLFQ